MSEVLQYRVAVLPERHELAVTMTVPSSVGGVTLQLQSPTSVPGNYSFNSYGRDVFDIQATDPESGAPLAVRRQRWQG